MKTLKESKAKNTAIIVANRIVAECDADKGEIISNLKLQKMLYYLQGFFIAMFDKKLFEEPILAWAYGPVVESAYHHFKKFENGAITLNGKEKMVKLVNKEYNVFKNVMDEYGQFSAIKLMKMTHEEPPWKETFNKHPNSEITYNSLKRYFLTQIE